ncbi:MAG: thiamine pyrophosphate-dependent enzyme [Candidatus Anstonellaceae archaeon]
MSENFMEEILMATVAELNSGHMPDWCPGCGDFGILISLKGALAKLDIPAHETVVASGIGCSGKLPHFIKTYGYEGLHGRSLPAATGIHLANDRLTVIDVGGDGDGYGIGMGHFVHTMRRNLNITYIVHNNEIYGLTTGQTSPTTKKGVKTKSTPHGAIEQEVNPLLMALSAGATFVARGFSGDIPYLTDLIAKGIQHRGIALIDVFQPCVTYRKDLPYELYQKKIYKLETEGHDPSNWEAAVKKAQEYERWPVGVFYQTQKPIYTDEIPFIKDAPLAKHDITNVDITKFIEEFF